MIRITNIEGRAVFLHPNAIAKVTEAGTSGQWHGIRSYVRTFDGLTIEAREHACEIDQAVSAVNAKRGADDANP
jgi:hypothetical protein